MEEFAENLDTNLDLPETLLKKTKLTIFSSAIGLSGKVSKTPSERRKGVPQSMPQNPDPP